MCVGGGSVCVCGGAVCVCVCVCGRGSVCVCVWVGGSVVRTVQGKAVNFGLKMFVS